MNKNNFLAILACGVLSFGCSESKPKKTYTLYEFADVDSSKFHAEATNIRNVTSSGQGMVYVVGQSDDDTVVIDRTDGASWEQMDLSTSKTPEGVARSLAFKDKILDVEKAFSRSASLNDGIIFYEVYDDRGRNLYYIGILNDNSTDASIAWTLVSEADVKFDPLSFTEWKMGEKYFLVTSINTKGSGLRSFERATLINKWEDGFQKTAAKPLDVIYNSTAITPSNDLLLAGKDGQIYKMDEASFKDKLLANDGAPVVPSLDLQHGSVNNSEISKMLYVDKYLLVGFKRGERKQGGLFFRDVSAGLPVASSQSQWDNVGEGLGITGMMVDRTNPKRAVITTDKGVMIFEDGNFEHFTKYMMFNPANKGRLEKDSPKSGAAGSVMSDSMTSVAQDKAGKFYFSTPQGVSTMVIKSEDF